MSNNHNVDSQNGEEPVILTATKIRQTVTRIAHEIVEQVPDLDDFAIVGVKTRGAVFAKRICAALNKVAETDVPCGALDVSLYRDDFDRTGAKVTAETTEIDFSIENKTLLLVDDVLFTGRTINAAIRALFDLGRPKKIMLAALIDRGHRELPYRPDFCGKNVPTQYVEKIRVRFKESDGRDIVLSGLDKPAEEKEEE